MSVRRTVVLAAALLAVGLGSAGCRDSAPSTSGGASELSEIQTTLDAIDSELAGDDSP